MFKILLSLLILISTPAWAVTQWNKGLPLATDLKSDWPVAVQAQWSIMDALLSNYRRGAYLSYSSSSAISVSVGETVVSTGGIAPRLFLQNTTVSSITTANLDTGASFSASTTYYVYAGATSATASSATYYISLSSTAPTGVTYYLQIGSFTTDSSANITAGGITNLGTVPLPTKALLGIDSGTGTANKTSDTTINFNFTFSSAPTVVISPTAYPGNDASGVYVSSVGTTSFTVKGWNTTGVAISWIATGTRA